MARKGKRNSVQSNAKRKAKPRGKPFEKGNTLGFQPGVSGNPGGRPKLLGEAYREWLAKMNTEGVSGKTNAEAIAIALGHAAVEGDVSAAREIRAATEGDKMELTGSGLVIRVVYDEKQIRGTDDTPAEAA